jgi:hypothetical protein
MMFRRASTGSGRDIDGGGERRLVHGVEAQLLSSNILRLAESDTSFRPSKVATVPGTGFVVAGFADEQRVEVQVVRGEHHRVLADVLDEERDELVAGLS